MWHEVSNGADVRPSDIDETSSGFYIYVRRNVRRVEASGEDTGAHYVWEELKIPREMWEVAREVFEHETALDDVYAALTEIAELIVGGVDNG